MFTKSLRLPLKLALLILPPVMIPIISIGWFANKELRDDTYRTALDQMQDGLLLVTHEVDKLITTATAKAELFARSEQLNQSVRTLDQKQRHASLQPALLQLLHDYQHAYPEVYEIRLMRPDGVEATRATLSGEGDKPTQDESTQAYFQQLFQSGEDLITEFRRDPDNGDSALYVFRRLLETSTDGQAITYGYLGLAVSLEKFYRNLGKHKIGQQGRILLIENNGEVILDTRQQSTNSPLPKVVWKLVQAGVYFSSPRKYYLFNQTFLIQARAFNSQLYALVAFPSDELEDPIAGPRIAVILATLSVLILYANLVYGGLHRLIVRPLRALHHATSEIVNGNFYPPIKVTSHDELGDIAQALQQLSQKLANGPEKVDLEALNDPLTGLPNHHVMRMRLEEAIHTAAKKQGIVMLLFLEIDNLKQINDTQENQVVDQLLIQVAERVTRRLENEDFLIPPMVSRIGNHQFLILHADIKTPPAGGTVVRRILHEIQQPFEWNKTEYLITATIGISIYPEDGADVDTLIGNAENAMRCARAKGRHSFQYYSANIDAEVHQRIALETLCCEAVRQRDFSLVYQPQVDLATGHIMALAASLRWKNSELNHLSWSSFVSIAEAAGLVCDVAAQLVSAACREAKLWQDTTARSPTVTVNLSFMQLQTIDTVAIILNALKAAGLEPRRLCIELAENVLQDASVAMQSVLSDITALGVKISLNDFGSGCFSPSRLSHFPISSIKIDRSFISELPDNPDTLRMTKSLIAMGEQLGFTVIAAGVESKAQLAVLGEIGCTGAQGFLFGDPLLPEAVPQFLKAFHATQSGNYYCMKS